MGKPPKGIPGKRPPAPSVSGRRAAAVRTSRCRSSAALCLGCLRAAARARWVGRVIASSADAAVAALEFKTDAWKLIAGRLEIA
jgi:hypothetical protein